MGSESSLAVSIPHYANFSYYFPCNVTGKYKKEIMLLSSKYKQIYECRLPAQAPHSQGYTGPSIPDLLKPMHTAPCLVKTKDWWTYEFCYGQHIRQYHLEDTGVKGDVFFPGYYDSEFDWINETAKVKCLFVCCMQPPSSLPSIAF
uniref:Endoplasmic reticulum lectin n=1 Tax=Oncorhynchus tshawytscha TaxID=74940 RepID=A0AAZ3R7L8_ONCTS